MRKGKPEELRSVASGDASNALELPNLTKQEANNPCQESASNDVMRDRTKKKESTGMGHLSIKALII